jgi:hypothetical protein
MNNPNDIARCEILKGLPGEGPVPRHIGSPTPWREGFVVRFWNASGVEWVGNFGRGGTPFSSVSDWSEAGFMVVVASGRSISCPRTILSNTSRIALTLLVSFSTRIDDF